MSDTRPNLEATPLNALTERRAIVLNALAEAANPPPVLVAVTKTQPDDMIDAILATGQRVFGENRVQEAQKRWTARREMYPDLELRLIGPLQTNKAEDAVSLFDVIETLDRPKLADALAAAIKKTGRHPSIFIEVNTGEEDQKAGVLPQHLHALIDHARAGTLKLEGLMCIPPQHEPVAPHFALLAKLAARHGLKNLSMGMSADYLIAAKLGATHVRLGSALFGERLKP